MLFICYSVCLFCIWVATRMYYMTSEVDASAEKVAASIKPPWQIAVLFSLSLHAAHSDTVEAPIHTADVAPGKSSGYKQVLSPTHLQKTSLSRDIQPQCICLRSAELFAWVSSNGQSVSASLKPEYKHYRHKGKVHSIPECIRRSA